MLLGIERISDIVCGVSHVTCEDGWICFHRMSEEQQNSYTSRPEFYAKALSSANVRLAFRTDAQRLGFDFRLTAASSRRYAWFDLYIDGVLVRHFGTEGGELTSGHIELDLGEGDKSVELYFPWSVKTDIAGVTLDDGATLSPVKRGRTMIAFGDSITQGFDNFYPSLSYVARLARMLGADEINKGVGGDKFRPDLAVDEGLHPDIVTVGYGSNDWTRYTKEEFIGYCTEFCTRLCELYPDAKIFVISPVWRADAHKEYLFGGPLDTVHGVIAECCAGLDNVIPINGYGMIPHTKEFFRDMRVHPNDEGSSLYAEGLFSRIVKNL